MLRSSEGFNRKRLRNAVIDVYQKKCRLEQVSTKFDVSSFQCKEVLKALPDNLDGEALLVRHVDSLLLGIKASSHQHYLEHDIRSASLDIIEGSISYKGALLKFGIPESTLRRKRTELLGILNLDKHRARDLCISDCEAVVRVINTVDWKGVKSPNMLTDTETSLIGLYAHEKVGEMRLVYKAFGGKDELIVAFGAYLQNV